MEESRTKHAKRNIMYGFLRQIIAMISPFIIRTVMINTLGAEFTGLNGVFSSIMMVFNVSELGFATAVMRSLYIPIAQKDKDKICKLLNFFRKIYLKIGLFLIILSISVLPFLHNLVKGDIPENINIYVLFLLTSLYSIAGYFLFAYKEVLVNACQRQDIISKIDIVIIVSQFLGQGYVLISLNNYYVFLLIQIVSVVMRSLIIGYCATRYFPKYMPEGNLNQVDKKCIFDNVKGIAIGKLTSTSRNGLDLVFISYFCGLIYVTIYQNYYLVYAAVIALIGTISSAIMAGIGNSIAVNEVENNYQKYLKFDFYYWILRMICAAGMLLFYQPFMNAWVGEDLLLDDNGMLMFVMYFYVVSAGGIRSAYIAGTGIWQKLKKINILELVCNVLLNFIVANYAGVKGIIAASIITVFIFSIVGNSIVLVNEYFVNKMKAFFLEFTKQTLFATIFLGGIYFVSCQIKAEYDVLKLCNMFICFIVIVLLSLCTNFRYRQYLIDICKVIM